MTTKDYGILIVPEPLQPGQESGRKNEEKNAVANFKGESEDRLGSARNDVLRLRVKIYGLVKRVKAQD